MTPARLPLARALDEFALTTVLLFLAVTVVRWLRHPASPLFVPNLYVALTVVGVLSGAILTALIFTPPGRRSGGHMNPAVTITVWLVGVFPGRSVLPYVVAQLAGSVAGTALARLVWGPAVTHPLVDFAAIRRAPNWDPWSVFVAELGTMAVLIVIVGLLLGRRRYARLLPFVIGLYIALTITFLGPRSGGSINPARQLGPAALAGATTDLWIYLVAPMLGAVIGAAVNRLLFREFQVPRPIGYKMFNDS
ncbi:MAG TPA: MIP/aquaporin family protein [Asanoa sp.]|nr:MIP/aquaporin family protein [Asanoa sp.]